MSHRATSVSTNLDVLQITLSNRQAGELLQGEAIRERHRTSIPSLPSLDMQKRPALSGSTMRGGGAPWRNRRGSIPPGLIMAHRAIEHDDLRADRYATIEVDHILVAHSNAAG